VVEDWCGRSPDWDDNLKDLWSGSGQPSAANWKDGAAQLADQLSPFARIGQTIDQNFILNLNPLTVSELADQLGW